MEYRLNVSCLQGRIVCIPGGRDKEGRPIILLTIPADSTVIDAVPSLQYLLSIFSKTSRSKGFTVIIDARKGPWKVARACIRQVNAVFTLDELAQLIVLRPDAFWDKQRVENCTSSQCDKQVIFIPKSRLSKFVDLQLLPTELGGNFIYNHDKWIENRQVEEFFFFFTIKKFRHGHIMMVSYASSNSADINFRFRLKDTQTDQKFNFVMKTFFL